jgi:lipoprotein NlpD
LIVLLVFLVSACRSDPDSWERPASHKSSYSLNSDGHYRVRRGDTLHAIAFNLGLDWRDIASWNHIAAPYTIYPDQQLRVTPPKQFTSAAKPKTSKATSPSNKQPSGSAAATTGSSRQGAADTAALKTPQATTTTTYKPPAPASSGEKTSAPARSSNSKSATVAKAAPGSWLWPTSGRIISNFRANDPSRNGIEIGGKEGQAIISTADGQVVYSGNGLIGYGELIIIKHSDRLLSAYAHNRQRLVSEGQQVKGGEKIAEMGRNDRNKALLHFEIRVNGTPSNPLDYLPQR